MRQMTFAYRWVFENRKWTGGILLLFFLVLPFLIGPYPTTMLVLILIYSLVAMGLGLLIGWAGQFSLGQGAFFGIGAYTSGFLSVEFGVNPWLAMLCSGALAGTLAYVLGKPLLSVPGYKVGFVTIGFSWLFHDFISRLQILGASTGFSGIAHFSLGGLTLDKDYQYYYITFAIFVLFFLLNQNFVRSKLGKQAKAMDTFTGGSALAAKSVGIDIGKLKTRIFMIAGVYAGIAGSLYAHYMTHLDPAPFSVWASILILLIIIMGGVKSTWGGVVGAAVYFGLQEALTFILGSKAPMGLQYLVFGCIVSLILLFFPTGIMGFISRLRHPLK
jgi:branched-chain amino acid transport system permease protein